jgi:hypothetical protein
VIREDVLAALQRESGDDPDYEREVCAWAMTIWLENNFPT